MSTEFAPPTPPPVGPQKEGMGCLGKGCIFFLVVLVLMFGAVSLGAYSMYRQLYDLTSDKPAEISVANSSKEEGVIVGKRYREFADAVNQGQAAQIRLTDQDLNTLVATDPALKDSKGKVYFKIHDGVMNVETSIDMSNAPFFKGRYLNADVTLRLFIENGNVTVEPTAVEANGKKLSPQFLKALQGLSWTESLHKIEGTGQVLDRIKALKLEDNALVIEVK